GAMVLATFAETKVARSPRRGAEKDMDVVPYARKRDDNATGFPPASARRQGQVSGLQLAREGRSGTSTPQASADIPSAATARTPDARPGSAIAEGDPSLRP